MSKRYAEMQLSAVLVGDTSPERDRAISLAKRDLAGVLRVKEDQVEWKWFFQAIDEPVDEWIELEKQDPLRHKPYIYKLMGVTGE